MKIAKIISFIAFIFFIFMLKMLLSSSVKNPPSLEPTDCESFDHATDYSSDIQIGFVWDGGYDNIPFRNFNWENFIPPHDLRGAYRYPETALSNANDSYYCVIEVTTNDCSEWEWSTIIPNPNEGYGNITIKLPDESYYWDVRLVIKYYETCSDGSYSQYDTLLAYEMKSNTISDDLYFGATTYIELYPVDEYNCYEFDNKDLRVNEIIKDLYSL